MMEPSSPAASSAPVSTPTTAVYTIGRDVNGESGRSTDADANTDTSEASALHSDPRCVNSLPNAQIASVGAGLYHCFAVTSSGELYSWGANSGGQLGTGASNSGGASRSTARGAASRRTSSSAPTLVSGLQTPQPEPVALATGGRNHSLALTSTHRLYCWGRPTHGQLGLASRAASGAVAGGGRSARGVYDVLDPRLLRALEHDGVAAVAAGEGFSLALTPAGTVHAWGRHASGRLGLPGWLSSSVDAPLPLPARAFGGRPVRTIAAGWRHALAVTASGALFSWGAGGHGQLGVGGTADLPAPTAVESLTKEVVLHVAAGGAHSLAATREGLVYAWGERSSGQLGLPATAAAACCTRPEGVAALLDGPPITQLACGAAHSAFLGSDGRLFTAGDDSYGQLGHAPPSDDDAADPAAWGRKPVPLPAGARVRQVACGAYHTVLLVEAPEEPGAIRSVPLTPRVD